MARLKTPKPSRTRAQELEELQTQAQQARVEQREADVQSRAQADSVERIRGQIVHAHAEGATRAVESLTKELAAQRLDAEQAELKADGLARRVANTAQAVSAFTAKHCDALVQELTPQAEAIRDRLVEGAEQVIRADQEWTAMSQHIGGILSHAPNATPREDMAGEHVLAPAVKELRQALASTGEVDAPTPHWHGRKHAADNQRRTRLARLQRKSNITDAEVREQTNLLAELNGTADRQAA